MSVALRTITRLQDADDVNVTLGAGVDEYALCWDNDTARFVLRAVAAGVSDHGALTGLSDDDHSQYLLATGARVGATSQAQAFTLADAVTNVVTNIVTAGHNTSGTAAAGFGGGLAFSLQSSTTASQSAAAINALWTDATHATRTSALQFQTVTSAGALTTALTLSTSAGLVGSLSVEATLGAYRFENSITPTTSTVNTRNAFTVNHNGTISQDATNLYNVTTKNGAGRQAGVLTSLQNYTLISGNGQVDTARGLWNNIIKTGSGNILSAQASYSALIFGNGGTVTASYGNYIDAVTPGTTTITTQYGLYIADQSAGGTNYAIYTGAGKVRLGDVINFAGTMGDSTKVPGTDAPADWVQVEIGGTPYYIPAYAAS